MKYQLLGRTGLEVSSIALGTVSLGVDYGIEAPGEFGRPSEDDAICLLQEAAGAGINFFDTSPAYGNSEYILGKALEAYPECYIATKVAVPVDAKRNRIFHAPMRQMIRDSLENSLRTLNRDVLDIVQIHNATADVIKQGEIAQVLLRAREEGKINFLGISVYTEEEALAAIDANCFDVLQVGYSILDQRMSQKVFPAAIPADVGVIARSTFLKGALTVKAQWLPESLGELKLAAVRVKDFLALKWQELPPIALRFSLSSPNISSVLIGPRTIRELRQALEAAECGSLSKEVLKKAQSLALTDQRLLNPTFWKVA